MLNTPELIKTEEIRNITHFVTSLIRRRSMKKLTLLTVALFLSSVTPAVAQDVRYDFDKDKDFSKYKTYKWVPIKGADMPDERTQKTLTSDINTEIAAKGM